MTRDRASTSRDTVLSRPANTSKTTPFAPAWAVCTQGAGHGHQAFPPGVLADFLVEVEELEVDLSLTLLALEKEPGEDRRSARPRHPQRHRPRHRGACRPGRPGQEAHGDHHRVGHLRGQRSGDRGHRRRQGADPHAIRRKAVERGIISAEVAQTLDDVRALDLLFEPGFSLAEKVTDVSGRGVGMDVVRSCIRGLHGTVTLTSRPGEGTRLSIKLPTSLMVSRGMMVEAGGGEYLLPVANIRELIKVPASAVRWYRQQALANIHGHLVPLVFLSAIVNESSQPASAAKELSIAVLDSHGTSYGVVVDRFGGETEALIKPLDARLEGVKLFLGATIMGDGRLMLVINPNGLALELVHERAA